MENSEAQKEVIELGRLLVKELGIENSIDTLGRWMAHYIAEKMEAAKLADQTVRPAIELECANLILDLWQHRWEIQESHQPLKDFGRLLDLLQQIDPEAFDPYYYKLAEQKKKEKNNPWLASAYDIDKAARVCLKYMLKKAAETEASEESKAILDVAQTISPDPDIMVIQSLLDKKNYGFDPNDMKISNEFNRDFEKQSIKNHIVYLDKVAEHAAKIKMKLEQELERKIKNNKSEK